MPPVPVLNAGFLKKRMSSIGSSTCSSQATKSASTTTAIANAPSVPLLAHPLSGAWIRP